MKRLSIVLVFLMAIKVMAQQPYFVQLNNAKGLPSNSVYDINQDAKGFIWIACDEGLYRYDGFKFKAYKNTKQTSIAGSNIKEDIKGRIWYQNFDGYYYYTSNDSLHSFNQNKPLDFFPAGASNNHLFVIQPNGIDVHNINTLQLIKTIPITTDKLLKYTSVVDNKLYYILNNSVYYVNEDLKVVKTAIKLDDQFAVPIICNGPSEAIVVSKLNFAKVLITINNNLIKRLPIAEVKTILGVKVIDNQYWVLSTNGIYIYKEDKLVNHLFKGHNISSVFKDKQQNYWISTLNSGIFIMPDLTNTYLSTNEDRPVAVIAHKKTFSIVTHNNNYNTYNNNFELVDSFKLADDLTNIYYSYFDSTNDYLFTSSLGYNIYNTATKKLICRDLSSLKELVNISSNIYAIASSGKINLFRIEGKKEINSNGWEVYFKNKKTNLITLKYGVRARTITYRKKNNSLYYGTNLGLFKRGLLNEEQILLNGESVFAEKVIATDKYLYILTTRGELYLSNNDSTFKKINDYKNIGFNEILNIKLIDNYLCVIGDTKLLLLNADNPSRTVYTPSIQLQTNETKDVTILNNKLIIGNINGILSTKIIPNQDLNNKASSLIIDRILVDGRVNTAEWNILPYYKNNITIEYALLDYKTASNNTIQYAINNQEWITLPNNIRSLQLASLAPDNYEILFKLNGTEVTSAHISFTIEKPYWLQWWFILGSIVLIVSVSLWYYNWQIRLIKNKNRLLRQKAELESNLSKSILTSIKSQMNPHFFYNALNTIQAYIFTNDKRKANTYLAKFSKLTRMILEMSEKETVSLATEIESLELYLELEQMRFEEDFEYKINVTENLEIEMVKIPPMLIQPYVENAIKHGLLHKEGLKQLAIEINRKNNNLIVTIIDNGVGLKRAQELKNIKNNNHQSFSSEANKKRLELLNQNKNNPVVITVTNRETEDGKSGGTIVNLIIPIN